MGYSVQSPRVKFQGLLQEDALQVADTADFLQSRPLHAESKQVVGCMQASAVLSSATR